MKFENTQKLLDEIGEEILTIYKDKIKNNPEKLGNGLPSVASGKLLNTVMYEVRFDNNLKLYLVLADHYVFVEKGSLFNNTMPPITAIRRWMLSKNIANKNGADFKIQRSIKKNGIKPKPHIFNIKKSLFDRYKQRIENELIKDFKQKIKDDIKQQVNTTR